MPNSNLTYAITNIIDESQYYIYPMAASQRGGAIESEFNIRNLMSCLFNKSSARLESSFILESPIETDLDTNTQIRRPLESYDGSSWFTFSTEDRDNAVCKISKIAVSAGEGNCNGYYIKLHESTPMDTAILDITDLVNAPRAYIECGPIPVGDETDDTADFILDINNNKYKLKDIETNKQKYFTWSGSEYQAIAQGALIDIDTTIYMPTDSYKDFNILLTLNWTTNQLVSACSITICEASTYDAFGNYSTLNTEYSTITRAAQDAGLLDAGILLGTLRLKKSWKPNATKTGLEPQYSVGYTPNKHKTTCIDLSKLGTGNVTLAEYLYDKLGRLYNLMVDNGSFKLGAVVSPTFNADPESENHNFATGLSNYRVELFLNPAEKDVAGNYVSNTATGGLRIINYDEQLASESEVSDILSFELSIDTTTGRALSINSISFLNSLVTLTDAEAVINGKFTLNQNKLYFGNGLELTALDSTILSVPNITTNSLTAATVSAEKVYGAVWM